MRLLVKATVLIAFSTRRPLIRSSTSLAFCGLQRWKRASARNSVFFVSIALCIAMSFKRTNLSNLDQSCDGLLTLRRIASLRRVALERARSRELSQLVAHHVLRAIHRNELAAVVHADRVADHVRMDRGAARPGADDLLLVGGVHRLDLDHQVGVDKRAL